MLCEQSSMVVTMLIYDWCSQGWHTGCLMLPLEKMHIEIVLFLMHQVNIGTYFYGQIVRF
jgi:hypothetical protein